MSRDIVVERKAYPKGTTIFREGSRGHTAFIVQKGKVEIVKSAGEKNEMILGTVGVGGMFGEMAVIDDSPRMATARAAEATTVIVVTEQMFMQKLEAADPFIRRLMQIMASTIRNVTNTKTDDAPS